MNAKKKIALGFENRTRTLQAVGKKRLYIMFSLQQYELGK